MPPLDLSSVAPDDLCRLGTSTYQDLGFLSGIIPEWLGPLVSTGVTGLAAGAAGLIDGFLGDKANAGPIDINTAVALASAAVAVAVKTTNEREAAAAVARGFGAPLIYSWAKATGQAWKATVSGRPTQQAPQAAQ